MEKHAPRWQQRLHTYSKALHQLSRAVDLYRDTEIDIIKEGIIQRFEFTHELAWKLRKDILLSEGFSDVIGSRSATREAFQQGLIESGQIWMDMIETRNRTVHTYEQSMLQTEFTRIINDYLPCLQQLEKKAQSLCQHLV